MRPSLLCHQLVLCTGNSTFNICLSQPKGAFCACSLDCRGGHRLCGMAVFSFLRVAPSPCLGNSWGQEEQWLALLPRTGVAGRVLLSCSDWGQIGLWVVGRLAQLWVFRRLLTSEFNEEAACLIQLDGQLKGQVPKGTKGAQGPSQRDLPARGPHFLEA